MEKEAADAAAHACEDGQAAAVEPAIAAVQALFAERQLSLLQVCFGAAFLLVSGLGIFLCEPFHGASVCCLISRGALCMCVVV